MSSLVAVSGYVDAQTGIGLVQRHLYPAIKKSHYTMKMMPSRDRGRSVAARVVGFVVGFMSPVPRPALFLSVVPPLALFNRPARTVSVIHDLRWQNTRGRLSKWYRSRDLRRTVRRSALLVCVSQRTFDVLLTFDGRARGKTVVAHLGPGIEVSFSDAHRQEGVVLLMGRAPHKRNELAAELLSRIKPTWCRRVVGVNLSPEACSTLKVAFGTSFESITAPTNEELSRIYARAESFLFLGEDEGFGLPYIEALSAGCQVIAVDQPLTRELLGNACVYVSADDKEADLHNLTARFVAPEVRNLQARQYSWHEFSGAVLKALRTVELSSW